MSRLFKDVDSEEEEEEEKDEEEEKLQINAEYANNYDKWRQKEELNKLKTKYGESSLDAMRESDDEDSSSSDDDDDDEDIENEISEAFEKDFYKTLSCLKRKDPKIYDESTVFFQKNLEKDAAAESKGSDSKSKSKKEKPLFLRDYERKLITERNGKLSDSEEEQEVDGKSTRGGFTEVELQRKLKESFREALEDDEEDEDDEFLKPKVKSEEEKLKEEEDYKQWLKGQQVDVDESEKEQLKTLRDFWTDPNLDPKEKFLRDYILDKRFLEHEHQGGDDDEDNDDDGADQRLEKVHDSDEDLVADRETIEKQEEFEHKYNFRFEEPDQEFIKRYPRTMENSLRRKDTRRSQKRAEVKERKEAEKLRKKEELKQLKALKRKEIEEKIDKLKEITGNDDLKFDAADLDGDFDPQEYDRKMQAIFNEEFYAEAEGDAKPEFPDIDEELGIESTWDTYNPDEEEIGGVRDPYMDDPAPHCEDPDFNMDADYNESQKSTLELIEGTKRKKKRRRRSKFAEIVAKEKPNFDPKLYKSYEEYFDQYYALDYEDMIGDLPCRFKYRKVVPNDFGLSIEEILAADDKELNKWCPLKKALQHKPEHVELNDVRMFKEKARNEALKRKILRSLYEPPKETVPENDNESKTSQSNNNNNNNNPAKKEEDEENGKIEKKKRKKKKKKQQKKITEDSEFKEISAEENHEKITDTNFENEKLSSCGSSEPKKSQKKERKRKLPEVERGGEIEGQEESVVNKRMRKEESAEESTEKIGESENDDGGGGGGGGGAAEDSPTSGRNSKKKEKKKKKEEKGKIDGRKSEIGEIRPKSKGDQKKNRNNNKNNNKNNNRNNKNNKNNNNSNNQNRDDKQISTLSDERLKAYGINPKKFKNKLKYSMKKRN